MIFKKIKNLFGISGFVFFMFLGVGNVLAHDVIHDIKQNNAIVIRAGYDSGEPMRYAEILIYSPKDSKIEFQNGRTDANGSFAFLPDMPGEWKITISGEDGHGFTENFAVDKSMNLKISSTPFQRFKKLASGVILIFGLTGFLYYLRARKMLAVKNQIFPKS